MVLIRGCKLDLYADRSKLYINAKKITSRKSELIMEKGFEIKMYIFTI